MAGSSGEKQMVNCFLGYHIYVFTLRGGGKKDQKKDLITTGGTFCLGEERKERRGDVGRTFRGAYFTGKLEREVTRSYGVSQNDIEDILQEKAQKDWSITWTETPEPKIIKAGGTKK